MKNEQEENWNTSKKETLRWEHMARKDEMSCRRKGRLRSGCQAAQSGKLLGRRRLLVKIEGDCT